MQVQVVFSIFFMAVKLLQKQKFMIVSLLEVSAFREIKEALRRLLSASVDIKWL